MRSRSLAALAAVSVLILAACGDDDEDAGGDTTGVVGAPAAATAPAAETTAADAETTTAAVETSAPGALATETTAAETTAVETTAVETTAVETTAAETTAAETTAVETTEVETTAVETTEVETTAVETTAVETTEVETTAVETTAVETTEVAAAAETTEAAAETTEAAAETTEAAAETTEAAAETTAAPESSAPESAPATSAPGSSVPAGEPGAITVGSANFPESELLAQIYGQALEAAGFDVSYELGIGAREAYLGAVEGGEVGLVPEYTGSLLAFISDEPPTATNVEEQVTAIGEELPEGLEVLTPSSAEDKDTIVCTQEVVDEFSLTDLSSLFENSADITLGAPPEFESRSPFGLAGFSEIYGAEFAEFVPLAPGDIPAALEAGEIDCGNIFSTDPAIDTGGFVALDDDQTIVPNEAVLPLVRSELVTPEMTAALDEVNAALDTETLTSLLAQVVNDQLGADVVAAEFLESLGGGVPATTAG